MGVVASGRVIPSTKVGEGSREDGLNA